MTKMHTRTSLAAFLLFVAGAPSCSVKEDRTPCPCYLQVSFTDPEASGPVILLGRGETTSFREQARVEDCRPYWTRPVDKGILDFFACKGIRQASVDGSRVTIPEGGQADSLYAFSAQVDATGEFAPVPVTLHKQFATVFLDIRKTAGELPDYRFSVTGNTCGTNLQDHSPIPGPFYFSPSAREGDAIVFFRLPRQADDSLSLSVRYGDAAPSVFPLGELIRDTGYSWKTEDLQDIYVSIDLTRGKILVVVGDWENGMNLPFVDA